MEEVDSDQIEVGLSCEMYGGPSEEATSEMMYWRDIPSDRVYYTMHIRRGDFLGQYVDTNATADVLLAGECLRCTTAKCDIISHQMRRMLTSTTFSKNITMFSLSGRLF